MSGATLRGPEGRPFFGSPDYAEPLDHHPRSKNRQRSRYRGANLGLYLDIQLVADGSEYRLSSGEGEEPVPGDRRRFSHGLFGRVPPAPEHGPYLCDRNH